MNFFEEFCCEGVSHIKFLFNNIFFLQSIVRLFGHAGSSVSRAPNSFGHGRHCIDRSGALLYGGASDGSRAPSDPSPERERRVSAATVARDCRGSEHVVTRVSGRYPMHSDRFAAAALTRRSRSGLGLSGDGTWRRVLRRRSRTLRTSACLRV